MMELISKTIRIPSDLLEFIETQPGDTFSAKLIGLVNEFRQGDEIRKFKLENYNRTIKQYDQLYRKLTNAYDVANRSIVNIMVWLDEVQQQIDQVKDSDP